MSLKTKVLDDIKSAMKSGEKDKLSSLRFLQAAIKNREIEVRPNEITDEDVLSVVKKMVKQHKDSIDQFEKASRQDLVEKEKLEMSFLEVYLPEEMGKDQIASIVEQVISSMGANSMKQMGQVMKEVMAKTAGAADNKIVSELVRAKLQ